MPENTWIYDTVWEEYREEHELSDDEMNEFIWTGNREVISDLEKRANKNDVAVRPTFGVDVR